MKLENSIVIPAAPEAVFAAVRDVERVVPCVPGAALTGRDGDSYRGGISVKVGPIRAAYSGTVEFLDVDTENRRLTMSGRAADTHGGGDAQAHVTLSVDPAPEGALLRVDTDLVLSGKIVAFGKGAIVAVSNKIMGQFAANLAAQLGGQGASPAAGDAPVTAPAMAAAVPAAGMGAAHSNGAATTLAVPADGSLDMMSLLPPQLARGAGYAAVFALGMVEGWLVTRAFRRCR